jgi:hypothetical protein
MTSDDKEALARRAVQCKGWRWMPGMRVTSKLDCIDEGHHEPGRVTGVTRYKWGVFVDLFDDDGDAHSISADFLLPDLSDPAALGCLFALVRKAWPAEKAEWPNNEPAWTIARHGEIPCATCKGERYVMRIGAPTPDCPQGMTHEDECEDCEGLGYKQSKSITGWVCGVPGGGQFEGASEVEALLAALEAAP